MMQMELLVLQRSLTDKEAPVRGLNPMALAIGIRADVVETTRISPKTWNQNPMGSSVHY